MTDCKRAVICKIAKAGECVVDICAFFATMAQDAIKSTKPGKVSNERVKRPYKRTVKATRPNLDDDSDINLARDVSKADFLKAKDKIAQAKFYKKLTDLQIAAMVPINGKRYESLTDGQLEQVMSIAKDLTKKG